MNHTINSKEYFISEYFQLKMYIKKKKKYIKNTMMIDFRMIQNFYCESKFACVK